MKRKVVLLQDNMVSENEQVIFEADVPYVVEVNSIENGDGWRIRLSDIWVDFHLVHKEVK